MNGRVRACFKRMFAAFDDGVFETCRLGVGVLFAPVVVRCSNVSTGGRSNGTDSRVVMGRGCVSDIDAVGAFDVELHGPCHLPVRRERAAVAGARACVVASVRVSKRVVAGRQRETPDVGVAFESGRTVTSLRERVTRNFNVFSTQYL